MDSVQSTDRLTIYKMLRNAKSALDKSVHRKWIWEKSPIFHIVIVSGSTCPKQLVQRPGPLTPRFVGTVDLITQFLIVLERNVLVCSKDEKVRTAGFL